jgi:hypothetical protein
MGRQNKWNSTNPISHEDAFLNLTQIKAILAFELLKVGFALHIAKPILRL